MTKKVPQEALDRAIASMARDVWTLYLDGRSVKHICSVFRLEKTTVKQAIEMKRGEAKAYAARIEGHPLWRKGSALLTEMEASLYPPLQGFTYETLGEAVMKSLD